MVVDGSEMVVVCKAVEVDPDLDSVALVQESCGKVLSGRSLTRLELDPRGLHGMQLGAEEWFRDTDLEDENASEQRLLQVHRLGLLLAPGVVRVVGVGSPSDDGDVGGNHLCKGRLASLSMGETKKSFSSGRSDDVE